VIHAPPQEHPQDEATWNNFLPLHFPAGGEDHRHLKKKKTQQVLVPFPSRFLDLLLPTDLFFFFWLSLLLFFRLPAVRSRGCWHD